MDLVIQERIKIMSNITKYIDPRLIAFLQAENRDQAIESLVDIAYKQGKIENIEQFYNAIIEREKIVSTGIGMGVAIPHAKLPIHDTFFIAIGILQKGVDWNAIDSNPVRLVFMIGGPDDKQTEYLQILSNLTQVIKNEGRRKKIFTANSAADIIRVFSA